MEWNFREVEICTVLRGNKLPGNRSLFQNLNMTENDIEEILRNSIDMICDEEGIYAYCWQAS